MSKTTVEQRFWRKVEKTDSCWNWLAGKDRHGYGSFGFRRAVWRAHRVAWVLANGEIPDGMHVCHTCDVRVCVNPDHLWLGTNAENTRDKMRKGRHGLHNPPRGSAHHLAKMTEEDVLRVRAECKKYPQAKKFWAATLGVSMGALRDVINRRRWKHI
jgi:hypothetical protein